MEATSATLAQANENEPLIEGLQRCPPAQPRE